MNNTPTPDTPPKEAATETRSGLAVEIEGRTVRCVQVAGPESSVANPRGEGLRWILGLPY